MLEMSRRFAAQLLFGMHERIIGREEMEEAMKKACRNQSQEGGLVLSMCIYYAQKRRQVTALQTESVG